MADARFNLPGLFLSIDAERKRLGLSWAALSRKVGVAGSTIRRLEQCEDAEADGVLALVRWLGVAPEDFVDGGSAGPERLPAVGEGMVRVDMGLVARACGDTRGAQGHTRTSIQRLVAACQSSRQSVASLTRRSEV